MPERAQDRPEVRHYEDIDFTSARHVSLLAVLSQANNFYYHDRKRFLNIKNEHPLVSPTGSAHGILAFAGAKAVAFIIYHKFDDTNPRHQTPTHPAIEIQFHLVDKKRRGRGTGTLLLYALEEQYTKRVVSVEVDATRDSAPYYTKMGYNLNFVTNPCFGTEGTYAYGRQMNFDGSCLLFFVSARTNKRHHRSGGPAEIRPGNANLTDRGTTGPVAAPIRGNLSP
jgi:hypothetical protein